MERFLRYSLTHARPIRLIYQDADGALRQCRATITAMSGDRITALCKRPKGELCLRPEQILSADYVPGDEGAGGDGAAGTSEKAGA